MSTNLKELRKEAYRLWGIGDRKVIYNFPRLPQSSKTKEFHFRLDMGDDKASWPRAYALAASMNSTNLTMRIIMPVIQVRKFDNFTLEKKAWYDMPMYLHEKIIELVNDCEVRRKPAWFKQIANRILPVTRQYSQEVVDVSDYLFSISKHHKDYVVRVS